jgi:RND family efflux transporter MFP subunit
MFPLRAVGLALAVGGLSCHAPPPPDQGGRERETPPIRVLVVRDTTISTQLEAAGIAQPLREATLGSRLMGAVTEVLVQEAQRVRTGELLARIDARDVSAQRSQTTAAIAEAEAVYQEAEIQAQRFRALYADSAASKAQLDAAETGLLRARAGMESARASAAGAQAVASYAEIRAPFPGTITRRFVDPGAFLTPGSPILSIQDASRLRIAVSVSAADVRGLTPGQRLAATIEGQAVGATLEGVVPATGGPIYTVNALVENPGLRLLPGSAATLLLPRGVHSGILVPEAALVREGDLTGVRVPTSDGASELRWVRIGRTDAGQVEVLTGLRAGESIAVPTAAADKP